MPGGGQADGVGRLGAGDEPDRRVRGQAEQLLEPAAGDLLGHGSRPGRGHGVERALVPAAASMSAAAAAGSAPPMTNPKNRGPARGDQARLGGRDQVVEHPVRRGGPGRQRPAQRGQQRRRIDRPGDGSVGQAAAVLDRRLRRGADQVGDCPWLVGHPVAPVGSAPTSADPTGAAGPCP